MGVGVWVCLCVGVGVGVHVDVLRVGVYSCVFLLFVCVCPRMFNCVLVHVNM